MTNQFLWGALALCSVAIGVFFLRFWKTTSDRFFFIFAVSFGMLAAHWVGLAMVNPANDARHYLYWLRFLAFLLILFGILDKNRKAS